MNGPSNNTQVPPSEQSPHRALSKEELKAVLEAHQKWLESGGKEGERAVLQEVDLRGANLREATLKSANLQEANLQGADLHRAYLKEADCLLANLQSSWLVGADLEKANLIEANLQEANLSEAKLQGADLLNANLRGADLREAKLDGAYLLRTTLREANLQDADLTGATGLLAGQLGGANVSGAKLPGAIGEFQGLRIAEEASKNARKLFHLMLSGCLYAWLTIATTTDARLLTNSASSPLPIIGAAIPIVGFYWAAPLFLLAVYIYFHLSLQRLWEGLASLPAVFPDGRALDERAYPWLLNGLVRAHFVQLRDNRPPLSRLQAGTSFLLAWWSVPATLVLFWARYLRRHDWVVTALHTMLVAVSIGAAILLYRLAAATLRGEEGKSFLWKKALKDLGTYKRSALFLGIGALFCILSFGAIDGVPPDFDTKRDLGEILRLELERKRDIGRISFQFPAGLSDLRRLVPRAFALVGYGPFADLQEAEVSTKPTNWTGQKQEEVALVKGADLKGKNLRYATALGAFLAKADLRGADLHRADLRGADLSGAELGGAKLQWAQLQGSYLLRTELGGAILQGARLQGANFWRADLRGADLTDATGLTKEQIASAVSDEKTRLPDYLEAPPRAEPKPRRAR